ncbi:MAG: DUF4433 domain-containing protein [Thermoplasmata archaeon]|nr:DUF4433 domain-containing protein [Thermoplasmata archaeon]
MADLPSILQRGLLSHNQAAALRPHAISDPAVQLRRSRVRVPGGLWLHDYVNLYFDSHNPMLSKIRHMNRDLVVLEVSKVVVDLPDVVIADRNAAKEMVRFGTSPQGLEIIDGGIVYKEFWKDPLGDPLEDERRDGIKCSEVLTPSPLLPRFLRGTGIVCSEDAKAAIEVIAPSLRLRVGSRHFFWGGTAGPRP